LARLYPSLSLLIPAESDLLPIRPTLFLTSSEQLKFPNNRPLVGCFFQWGSSFPLVIRTWERTTSVHSSHASVYLNSTHDIVSLSVGSLGKLFPLPSQYRALHPPEFPNAAAEASFAFRSFLLPRLDGCALFPSNTHPDSPQAA